MKLLCLILLLALTYADRPTDRVKNLPGVSPQPTFPIYSGYIPIPNSGGKQIHYVFMESQNNPKSDPVVLWLNGGPGCSSMDGLFYENGPYVFQPQSTKLLQNAYSWNQNASMLYFEAPAGVGFSILGESANNYTDDNTTAHDNGVALSYFFTQYFPEFAPNKFFIAGESYAGIYVPTLAYWTLQYNILFPNTKINLQGIMVGNGVTDWNYDATAALPDFLWWHTIYGYPLRNTWVNNNCTVYSDSAICQNTFGSIMNLMNNINIYDIYRDCDFDNQVGNKYLYTSWLHEDLQIVPPCVDALGLTYYMNSDAVRAAFNIPDTLNLWSICTTLDYQVDYERGSVYLYPELVQSGLRILIYSGDTDAAVPVSGTAQWINNLNMTVTNDWREWYLQSPPNGNQVAGFVVNYGKNFTFMTIKGVGHMSIQWKRPEGYHMFLNFINGLDP